MAESLNMSESEVIQGEIIKKLAKEKLSDEAKKELKEARATPSDKYISQEDIEKEFL